jgi:hypothetical protein
MLISYQQKGLIKEVNEIFPEVDHKIYVLTILMPIGRVTIGIRYFRRFYVHVQNF